MDITAHLFAVTFWTYLIMAVDIHRLYHYRLQLPYPTIGINGPFHSMLNGASESKFIHACRYNYYYWIHHHSVLLQYNYHGRRQTVTMNG